ncbi:hypothetical protein EON64_10620 [archaeon]|nr:MAG: hypothetical protein EON64_10620 [archaeon]
MGNVQTTTEQTVDGVPIRSVEEQDENVVGVPASLVKVTGAGHADLEKALKDAYAKGLEEGEKRVQNMLEHVAAEVYDNVHSQLSDIQRKQLQEAQARAEQLKGQLNTVQIKVNEVCTEPRSVLLRCMKEKGSLLECEGFVNAYVECNTNFK